jgi:hypothetical protein
MPKYFFHVHHERSSIDYEGEELADMNAVWQAATTTAGEMIRDLGCRLRPGQDWRLEVTDELDNRLCIIRVNAQQFA